MAETSFSSSISDVDDHVQNKRDKNRHLAGLTSESSNDSFGSPIGKLPKSEGYGAHENSETSFGSDVDLPGIEEEGTESGVAAGTKYTYETEERIDDEEGDGAGVEADHDARPTDREEENSDGEDTDRSIEDNKRVDDSGSGSSFHNPNDLSEKASPIRRESSASSSSARLHSLAASKAHRRQLSKSKREEEEIANVRDTPAVLPKSKDLARNRGLEENTRNYGEFLYNDSIRRQQRKELAAKQHKEQQESEEKKYRFKPDIPEYGSPNRNNRPPIEERLVQKEEERERRIRRLAEAAEQDKMKECTFKPTIGNFKFREKRGDFLSHIKKQELQRQLKMVALQQQHQVQEGYTYQPRISSDGEMRREGSREKIWERLHRHAMERQRQVDALKEDRELYSEHFSPSTRKSISPRSQERNIADDLYEEARRRKEKQEKLLKDLQEREKSDRNRVKLNERSRELARRKIVKRLREIFDQLDVDKNGVLSFDEVLKAFNLLGVARVDSLDAVDTNRSQSLEELKLVQRAWDVMDHTGNGVDFDSFSNFMSSTMDAKLSNVGGFDTKVVRKETSEEVLARKFGQLVFNKLAYTPIHNFKDESIIQSLEKDCTFKPTIDKESKKIGKRHQAVSQEGRRLSHVEILLRKRQETEKKLEEKRMEKDCTVDKECTFKPKINRTRQPRGFTVERVSAKSAWEALHRGARPATAVAPRQLKSLEERELEQCTFKPTIYSKKRPSTARSSLGQVGSKAPKGYAETIERMRRAKEMKEERKREEEKVFSMERYAKASKKPVKPFNLLTEGRSRTRTTPLLYMDVNLGPGKTGRIGIHENDDPQVLARNFAVAYQLDDNLREILEGLIEKQIEEVRGESYDNGGFDVDFDEQRERLHEERGGHGFEREDLEGFHEVDDELFGEYEERHSAGSGQEGMYEQDPFGEGAFDIDELREEFEGLDEHGRRSAFIDEAEEEEDGRPADPVEEEPLDDEEVDVLDELGLK